VLFNLFSIHNWLRILPAILALSHSATLNAAISNSGQGLIDFDHDIGLAAASREQQFCLSIKNGELKSGQGLTLVWIPISDVKQTAEIRSATVRKLLTGSCDAVNSVGGDAAYDLDAGKFDIGKIYIAIAGSHADLRVLHGVVEGKLDSRDSVSFRACSSMEGLHFSAWMGGALKEKQVWHRYYYLGYDVEPTCKDRDFKERAK
jgi:hypothetical protein